MRSISDCNVFTVGFVLLRVIFLSSIRVLRVVQCITYPFVAYLYGQTRAHTADHTYPLRKRYHTILPIMYTVSSKVYKLPFYSPFNPISKTVIQSFYSPCYFHLTRYFSLQAIHLVKTLKQTFHHGFYTISRSIPHESEMHQKEMHSKITNTSLYEQRNDAN